MSAAQGDILTDLKVLASKFELESGFDHKPVVTMLGDVFIVSMNTANKDIPLVNPFFIKVKQLIDSRKTVVMLTQESGAVSKLSSRYEEYRLKRGFKRLLTKLGLSSPQPKSPKRRKASLSGITKLMGGFSSLKVSVFNPPKGASLKSKSFRQWDKGVPKLKGYVSADFRFDKKERKRFISVHQESKKPKKQIIGLSKLITEQLLPKFGCRDDFLKFCKLGIVVSGDFNARTLIIDGEEINCFDKRHPLTPLMLQVAGVDIELNTYDTYEGGASSSSDSGGAGSSSDSDGQGGASSSSDSDGEGGASSSSDSGGEVVDEDRTKEFRKTMEVPGQDVQMLKKGRLDINAVREGSSPSAFMYKLCSKYLDFPAGMDNTTFSDLRFDDDKLFELYKVYRACVIRALYRYRGEGLSISGSNQNLKLEGFIEDELKDKTLWQDIQKEYTRIGSEVSAASEPEVIASEAEVVAPEPEVVASKIFVNSVVSTALQAVTAIEKKTSCHPVDPKPELVASQFVVANAVEVALRNLRDNKDSAGDDITAAGDASAQLVSAC
jgi:hypothetical protein